MTRAGMRLRWIPNAITLARLVLALPLLWLLVRGRFFEALCLAVVAGLSDGLDGFLAKRYDWRTALGGVLDPIADKVMLMACFFGLWWSLQIPGWIVALVFARDLVIVAGAFAWWRVIGTFKPSPSLLSKANTALQLLLVAVFLGHAVRVAAGLSPVPMVWLQGMVLAVATLTVASGADYVIRYGTRAIRAHRSK